MDEMGRGMERNKPQVFGKGSYVKHMNINKCHITKSHESNIHSVVPCLLVETLDKQPLCTLVSSS